MITFQSASIVAASGRKFFQFLFSQILFMIASGGKLFWFLFLVSIVAATGRKFVLFPFFSVYFGSYFSSTNVIFFSINLF